METDEKFKKFEEFEVGEKIKTPGRTVTEADIVNFAGISGDYNRLHTDEQYMGEESEYGTRIAHGALIFSIMTGLLSRVEGPKVIAFYGVDKLRFTAPVFPDDTVHVVQEVKNLEKHEKGGLITFQNKVKNQKDETVLSCEQKLLVK